MFGEKTMFVIIVLACLFLVGWQISECWSAQPAEQQEVSLFAPSFAVDPGSPESIVIVSGGYTSPARVLAVTKAVRSYAVGSMLVIGRHADEIRVRKKVKDGNYRHLWEITPYQNGDRLSQRRFFVAMVQEAGHPRFKLIRP